MFDSNELSGTPKKALVPLMSRCEGGIEDKGLKIYLSVPPVSEGKFTFDWNEWKNRREDGKKVTVKVYTLQKNPDFTGKKPNAETGEYPYQSKSLGMVHLTSPGPNGKSYGDMSIPIAEFNKILNWFHSNDEGFQRRFKELQEAWVFHPPVRSQSSNYQGGRSSNFATRPVNEKRERSDSNTACADGAFEEWDGPSKKTKVVAETFF